MSKHEITVGQGDPLEVTGVGGETIKLLAGKAFVTEDDEQAAVVAERARLQGREVTVVTTYEDGLTAAEQNLPTPAPEAGAKSGKNVH